jgi:hypothetical protein
MAMDPRKTSPLSFMVTRMPPSMRISAGRGSTLTEPSLTGSKALDPKKDPKMSYPRLAKIERGVNEKGLSFQGFKPTRG